MYGIEEVADDPEKLFVWIEILGETLGAKKNTPEMKLLLQMHQPFLRLLPI